LKKFREDEQIKAGSSTLRSDPSVSLAPAADRSQSHFEFITLTGAVGMLIVGAIPKRAIFAPIFVPPL
jgi:hypothetical protein